MREITEKDREFVRSIELDPETTEMILSKPALVIVVTNVIARAQRSKAQAILKAMTPEMKRAHLSACEALTVAPASEVGCKVKQVMNRLGSLLAIQCEGIFEMDS